MTEAAFPHPTTDPVLAYLMLRTALEHHQVTPAELDPAQRAEIAQQAQRQFDIEARILATPEACEAIVNDTQFQKALQDIQQRYPDADTFQADLARNGMDSEGFQKAIYRELQVEAVLERVSARSAAISDLDTRIYYYMHLDKFQKPETRTIRHILITINTDYAENSRDAAHKRLTAIAKRLAKKPDRFAEQALKHSECPSAMHEGLIGTVTRGKLFPELDSVLFTMQANTISDIVESEMGLHVLYCEAIFPAGSIPFKEAEPKIRDHLQQRRQRICQKYWLSQLPPLKNSKPEASA